MCPLHDDNVTVGYDKNADDDIADAGDDNQFDDTLGGTTVTLTYDDTPDLAALRQGRAGNLTDDRLFKFVYDAWNRLVKATRANEVVTGVGDALQRTIAPHRSQSETWATRPTPQVASSTRQTPGVRPSRLPTTP